MTTTEAKKKVYSNYPDYNSKQENTMEQMLNLLKEILKQDDFFSLNAQITKKTIDALVKEGFTRQEAIELVRSQSTAPIKFG